MEPYEPDQITLGLLQAEHVNGTWVGKELLPIASRIRNSGGSEDDYLRWVTSSNLWMSYTGSTGDKVKKQHTALESAWGKAQVDEPFDTEEALTALRERIYHFTGWPNGRTASRDRAVALALIDFCIEHNCYTRTISSYELAKYTSAASQRSVARALAALTDQGLIREVQRTDRRTSDRSAKRYTVNLRWQLGAASRTPSRGVTTPDSRSTDKVSLSHELQPLHDLWSRRGLGTGAQRVYEALTDEPATARQLGEALGMNRRSVKRYAEILAYNALAGIVNGNAPRYFRVDTPLDAVADALGIYGHVEIRRWEIEQRQHANRAAYPGAYRKPNIA